MHSLSFLPPAPPPRSPGVAGRAAGIRARGRGCVSTPWKHPGRGGPRRSARRAGVRWVGEGNCEGQGDSGSPGVPATGVGPQCQCSAGVPSNTARGWSGENRAPLTLRLPSLCFPALVISCLWPDISREQMEGDYNEDLCVFRARLVSQCREPRSLLPISIFHSRFGECSRARGELVCTAAAG